MQIRMGDIFRDGVTDMQVYGFRDGLGGRMILVVTQDGHKAAIDPCDLMEDCAPVPTKKRDALVVFDSKEPSFSEVSPILDSLVCRECGGWRGICQG